MSSNEHILAILPGFDERKFFKTPFSENAYTHLSPQDKDCLLREFIEDDEVTAYLTEVTFPNYQNMMLYLIKSLAYTPHVDKRELDDLFFDYLQKVVEYHGADNLAYEEIQFVLVHRFRPLSRGERRKLLNLSKHAERSRGVKRDKYDEWIKTLRDPELYVSVKTRKGRVYLVVPTEKYEKYKPYLSLLEFRYDICDDLPEGVIPVDMKAFVRERVLLDLDDQDVGRYVVEKDTEDVENEDE